MFSARPAGVVSGGFQRRIPVLLGTPGIQTGHIRLQPHDYRRLENELLACNVNNRKWLHRTVVFSPIIFRRPQRESRSRLLEPEREYKIFERPERLLELKESISRLFKPSLFRFDGGGQLWDSYQCGIDDPMSN
jgi:hypothetical protein